LPAHFNTPGWKACALAMFLASCAEGGRAALLQADAGSKMAKLLPIEEGNAGTGRRERGRDRWRNSGVYVDGEPVAVLTFGELPIALKPVWRTDQVSVEMEPGQDAPTHRETKIRCYRFTELLTALRIDLAKVRELHVYGPKPTDSIVVTGTELRRRGRDFFFRFAGDVEGKPIPIVPPRFGNARSPDKISAVLVYVDKKPPRLIPNEGFELDGRTITGIPYHGEPMKGGVRVYLEDRLAMVIKRRNLGSATRQPLVEQLESHGIDTEQIAEVWAIHQDRRVARFTREELKTLSFRMAEGAQGELLLGERDRPVSAIALHKKRIDPDLLPKILPEEEF
jgi:hypothetical protein